MKVRLNKPVIGYRNIDEVTVERKHADVGDVLPVILNNKTHYICDSVKYPGDSIIVFPSQCSETIEEIVIPDEYDIEKYYHVYENHSKQNLDDPFYTAFESVDDV